MFIPGCRFHLNRSFTRFFPGNLKPAADSRKDSDLTGNDETMGESTTKSQAAQVMRISRFGSASESSDRLASSRNTCIHKSLRVGNQFSLVAQA